jgi:hypothetical protein
LSEHDVLGVKVLRTVGANSLTQFQFMETQYLGSILSQRQEVSIEVAFSPRRVVGFGVMEIQVVSDRAR